MAKAARNAHATASRLPQTNMHSNIGLAARQGRVRSLNESARALESVHEGATRQLKSLKNSKRWVKGPLSFKTGQLEWTHPAVLQKHANTVRAATRNREHLMRRVENSKRLANDAFNLYRREAYKPLSKRGPNASQLQANSEAMRRLSNNSRAQLDGIRRGHFTTPGQFSPFSYDASRNAVNWHPSARAEYNKVSNTVFRRAGGISAKAQRYMTHAVSPLNKLNHTSYHPRHVSSASNVSNVSRLATPTRSEWNFMHAMHPNVFPSRPSSSVLSMNNATRNHMRAMHPNVFGNQTNRNRSPSPSPSPNTRSASGLSGHSGHSWRSAMSRLSPRSSLASVKSALARLSSSSMKSMKSATSNRSRR